LAIQTNRTLGGIGAVFSVLGAISSISSVLLYGYPTSSAANLVLALISGVVGLFAFVGFILFLIAMYGFSRDYNEHRIFNYILYGFLCTIVAAIIAVAIVVVIFLSNLGTIIPNLNQSTTTPSQVSTSMSTFMSPFLTVFSFVGVIWVVFNVLAFRLLGEKSGVPLFRTGALVLLAGAVVNVGVGILLALLMYSGSIDYNTFLLDAIPGGLVQDVAWVLLAMAFFRIKVPPDPPFSLSSVAPAAGQMTYCQNCGTPNQTDAAFCSRCGQKLY
jgi:uncharacterized membrane protein